MSNDPPVTDNRGSLTHNSIPESLVARGRDSGGNIQLGEIKYLHRARDPCGNPLPDPPRFGDLLTPAVTIREAEAIVGIPSRRGRRRLRR